MPMLGRPRSSWVRFSCLFAPLKDGQLLVEPRNHFPDTGLGKALRSNRMRFLQFLQTLFEAADFLLRFLIFGGVGNHNSISTSPLRRPSASRVREKNSHHASQSASSSAAKISSGRRL